MDCDCLENGSTILCLKCEKKDWWGIDADAWANDLNIIDW
jgi:hypothetical protein